MAAPLVDVLVIGAGPAGLATATGLARQLYSTVVFDSAVYRNARATHMHNVPTWDHRPPAEFRQKARDDLLARYNTVRFEATTIASVARTPKGQFLATDDRGNVWRGRKLVLATGVRDVYPDIDGYDECWGRGIYHCLFCHGYEDRGVPSAGVLAVGDMANAPVALHLARMAKRLATDVTLYTDGAAELAEQMRVSLGAEAGFTVDDRRLARLEKGAAQSEVIVALEDGTTKAEGFLVHKPKTEINGPFAQQLRLELTDQGDIKTTPPFYQTTVPGVFAVGDCATPLKAVAQAVAMGGFGAGGLVGQLQVEPIEEP